MSLPLENPATAAAARELIVPDGSLTLAKTAGLADALADSLGVPVPTPLNIVDDRGGQTITHTSPIYLPEGFAGYRYWMAYTPYPGADEENPRLVASHDGVSWEKPPGLPELLATFADAKALGYIGWSDTDLVFDGSKLRVIYRGYGGSKSLTADSSSGVFTCAAHQYVTGNGFAFVNGTPPTGLSLGVLYYVIPTGADTFKLASSRANAIAGTALSFSSNGTSLSCQSSDCLHQNTWDGTTLTASTLILEGLPATLLSPSLIQKPDGTWVIYALNLAAGGVRLYQSTDGVSGWTHVLSTTFPAGTSIWHLAVRYYGNKYYAVVTSRRGWQIYTYESLDGTIFTGRGTPFIPPLETSLDTGGYYRSGFYVSGATPPMLNIYAVAMDGSTANVNNAAKNHKCYIYRKAYESSAAFDPFDWDAIQAVDYFLGGQDATASEQVVGDLKWSFYTTAGGAVASPGGGLRGGAYETKMPGISCVSIKTGSGAGATAGLQFDHETAAGGGRFPWNYSQLCTIAPQFRIAFRVQSLADSIFLGFGSSQVSGSPSRWVGLQLTPASPNWRFVSREASGANYDVDSTVVATAGSDKWWAFEMRWTGSAWQMRIWPVNAFEAGRDWFTVTNAINPASGINFGLWTVAAGATAAELRVCKWAFRGTYNGY